VSSEGLSSSQRRRDGRRCGSRDVRMVTMLGRRLRIDRREGRDGGGDMWSKFMEREGSGSREERWRRRLRGRSGSLSFLRRLERDVSEMVNRVQALLRRGHRFFPEDIFHGIDFHLMVRQETLQIRDGLLENSAQRTLFGDTDWFE
jgi:hypothetical protein